MSKVYHWNELDSLDLYQNIITCEINDSDKTVGIIVSIMLSTCGDKIDASAVISPLDNPENYVVCDFVQLKVISIEPS